MYARARAFRCFSQLATEFIVNGLLVFLFKWDGESNNNYCVHIKIVFDIRRGTKVFILSHFIFWHKREKNIATELYRNRFISNNGSYFYYSSTTNPQIHHIGKEDITKPFTQTETTIKINNNNSNIPHWIGFFFICSAKRICLKQTSSGSQRQRRRMKRNINVWIWRIKS